MSEDINEKEQNESDSNEEQQEQANTQPETEEQLIEKGKIALIQPETEEQLIEKGKIALIQLETEGKKYFKPQNEVTYRLTFDRAAALDVRGQPSEKLTRKIADRNDPKKIVGEVPVLEWVYEITHISGNKQQWSVTSKKLAAKILKQLISGKSVLDVTKTRTGTQDTDVEYNVVGIS